MARAEAALGDASGAQEHQAAAEALFAALGVPASRRRGVPGDCQITAAATA